MAKTVQDERTDEKVDRDIDELLRARREQRQTSPLPSPLKPAKPHKKPLGRARIIDVREFVQTSFAEMEGEEKREKKSFVIKLPDEDENLEPQETFVEPAPPVNVSFEDYLGDTGELEGEKFPTDEEAPEKARRIRDILLEEEEEGAPPHFPGIYRRAAKKLRPQPLPESSHPLDEMEPALARKKVVTMAKSLRARRRWAAVILAAMCYLILADRYPVLIGYYAGFAVAAQAGLILLLLAVCREIPKLAFAELAAKTPGKAALAVLAASLSAAHTLIYALHGHPVYTLYPALCVFMLFAEETYKVRKLRLESKLIFSSGAKYGPVWLPQDGYLSDLGDNKTAAVRFDEVSGAGFYYARSLRGTAEDAPSKRLLPAAVLLTALCVWQSLAARTGLPVLTAALLSCCAALPYPMLAAFAVPYGAVSRKLRRHGAILAGEAAVDELYGADELLLSDEQIFKGAPPTLTGIKLYGGEELEPAVICAASIAVTLGMPLGAAFLQLLDGRMDRLGAVTEIKYQDELGLYSFMNGNVVAMGDGEFMKQNMIRLPRDGAGERIRKNGDEPLYLAIGGRLAAIFAVRYDLTGSTATALRALLSTGVGLLVATNDPLLTAPILTGLLGQKQAALRILPSRNRDELELAPGTSEKVTALSGR
ncbi:MAG TPA: hypothetical protein VN369_03695, partial [Terriglobales bacterium]|nr:hypothetical protein [Terriglobales bacterium]